ncbi:hypothetical protein PG996_003550 [Apiospora saccharicola]|uniref:Uncharacterized protein n=1 Tax=Apiospora saccharicola TaxID=335842 RepID=A0ABR1W1K5_9PEZI
MSNTDYRHAAAAQYPYQQSTSPDDFTPEMRDRQARGKDPYHDSGDDSEGASGDWGGRNRGSRDESYAYIEQRRHAAQILDNPELLMTNAQREGDSIPATRLRYTRMLCGVVEEDAPSTSSKQSGDKKKKSKSSRHSSSGQKSASSTPKKRSSERSSRTH